ncbi:cytochrome c-type biogenesis protein CcmH [Ignatzschineria rhizosphaerae]|uniref:Cytochrome c-type biogenesis protein n=1 Tax=Ignatzschineria rhizosphaerae TaxID=2923279 RepID=A0ABY3X1X1_9GAMM|nr:cytochrome c-type biogenesis protein [Ignatzschineria rhizosphaerae]UNM95462.1 cytochrome c-type biogenesis protein CcmH [Ignatzschineria rhizosphaerae]
MKRFLIACTIFLSLFLQQGMASVNLYEFSNSIDERRFQSLTRELRCPKCQNQNIADSDAPLAQDMRDLTYDMIIDGQADAQIIAFMVDRYGDFVMYNPPVKPVTWLLWFSPFVLLVFILGVVFLAKGRKRKPQVVTETTTLSAEDQARLNEILQRKDN